MSMYVLYCILGLITRRSQVQILPPPPYFSSAKSTFNTACHFSGSHPGFDLPNHIPNHLAGFSVPVRPPLLTDNRLFIFKFIFESLGEL